MAMDFIDQVKQFSKRIESLKDTIQTEEATKTAIIMPFFAMLGYDVFNPQEFVPEYTADVGIKKGEKVDYAVMMNGDPAILVEAKSITEKLDKHDSQLFRYFGTTKAKFAILTNGTSYRFYTDLDAPNKMDETPFLDINLLDVRENQVAELKKFHKSIFDANEIFDTASVLKYTNIFKQMLSAQLQAPSDEFVRLFLQEVYSGVKTQAIIEKFRPVLKKSLNEYISETMNDKIKSALGTASEEKANPVASDTDSDETESDSSAYAESINKIETTVQELEAFFLIKNLLHDIVPVEHITYKDTVNYFGCLYKGNSRKWICRLILKDNQSILVIPNEDKSDLKITLTNIYDLNNYKEQLQNVLKRYID